MSGNGFCSIAQIITVQKPTEMPLQIVSQVTAAVTLISTSEVCSSTNCSQIPITPEIECGDEEGLLDKTLGDNPVCLNYSDII